MAQRSPKVSVSSKSEQDPALNSESSNPEEVMKPKFYYLKRLFMPWKWKKKKKSEKFKQISTVLERKMSTRITKDQLLEMGLIPPSYNDQDKENVNVKENPCFDEADTKQDSVSVFVKNLNEDSSKEKDADQSWVSEVGVIPPPEMFSPPSQRDLRNFSKVSIMAVGEGLDLSDPNLSEKIGKFSLMQEDDISDNSDINENTVEAINKHLNSNNTSTNNPTITPKLLNVVTSAVEQNRLVLEVENSRGDSEVNKINQGGIHTSNESSFVSVKRMVTPGHSSVSKPLIKEKPTIISSPKTLGEEWQEKRERIGKNLERRLSTRPSAEELRERNLIPKMSREEKEEIKRRISVKLERRLSIRPTETDLKNRNILRNESAEESRDKKEETRNILQRKLSIRPSVAELQKRKILKFSEYIEVIIVFFFCLRLK